MAHPFGRVAELGAARFEWCASALARGGVGAARSRRPSVGLCRPHTAAPWDTRARGPGAALGPWGRRVTGGGAQPPQRRSQGGLLHTDQEGRLSPPAAAAVESREIPPAPLIAPRCLKHPSRASRSRRRAHASSISCERSKRPPGPMRRRRAPRVFPTTRDHHTSRQAISIEEGALARATRRAPLMRSEPRVELPRRWCAKPACRNPRRTFPSARSPTPRADPYWPAHRLVVETDGWDTHKTAASAATAARTPPSDLRRLPRQRFTWRLTDHDPDMVVEAPRGSAAA
jgi:hypothetical protein